MSRAYEGHTLEQLRATWLALSDDDGTDPELVRWAILTELTARGVEQGLPHQWELAERNRPAAPLRLQAVEAYPGAGFTRIDGVELLRMVYWLGCLSWARRAEALGLAVQWLQADARAAGVPWDGSEPRAVALALYAAHGAVGELERRGHLS